jgi:hypothetical protein
MLGSLNRGTRIANLEKTQNQDAHSAWHKQATVQALLAQGYMEALLSMAALYVKLLMYPNPTL